MKLNFLRNTLGLTLILAGIILFSSQFSSCKKDDAPNTTLIVTVQDTLSKPLNGVSVTVYVPASSKNQPTKPVPGLPRTQFTGPDGKTTFSFDNGIVVFIRASQNGITDSSYATMAPGETFSRKIILQK